MPVRRAFTSKGETDWSVGYNEGYAEGYSVGFVKGRESMSRDIDWVPEHKRGNPVHSHKPKRKLSAWNKFVKANSKKPRFRFANGKLKLKKMAIAFRRTPAGKKRKR
jgi:hypothetical protein